MYTKYNYILHSVNCITSLSIYHKHYAMSLNHIKRPVVASFTSTGLILICFSFQFFWYFYSSSFLDTTLVTLLMTSLLGSHICLSQVVHLILKSVPILMISQSYPPQGCCFLSFTISPTFSFSSIFLAPLSLI